MGSRHPLECDQVYAPVVGACRALSPATLKETDALTDSADIRPVQRIGINHVLGTACSTSIPPPTTSTVARRIRLPRRELVGEDIWRVAVSL